MGKQQTTDGFPKKTRAGKGDDRAAIEGSSAKPDINQGHLNVVLPLKLGSET